MLVVKSMAIGLVALGAITVAGMKSAVVTQPSAPGGGGCIGQVSIESDEDGLPTGPASLDCLSPCQRGCQSNIIIIQVEGASQRAAVCSCAGGSWDGCCTVALTPPSSAGGGVGLGSCGTFGCPTGISCEGVYQPPGGGGDWKVTAGCTQQ